MGSNPGGLLGTRTFIRGLAVLSAETAVAPFEATVRFPQEFGERAVFPLSPAAASDVAEISGLSEYAKLDKTTQMAIACARRTKSRASEHCDQVGCVSLGSSRGPTESIERSLAELNTATNRLSPLTSPVTTAGNLSSWVAQDLLLGDKRRPVVVSSTSMTCSSAFQSLLVSYSMLKAGMVQSCLFGGSEACLTNYTFAQLDALRIYSTLKGAEPCRPCASDPEESSCVVLGEAAGTAIVAQDVEPQGPGDLEILGLGWSMESIPSATGISDDGAGFESAMRMALSRVPSNTQIDGVIVHAPGTIRGDRAEQSAVKRVFGDVPLFTTKHRSGHTYGASGMVSLQLAQDLLNGSVWRGVEYVSSLAPFGTRCSRALAINTAGFGGNAVCAIVAAPSS